MSYEYVVETRGMSVMNGLEDFGASLQEMLNAEGTAHAELGWELWHVQVVTDSSWGGNNGLVYVYRRPKP